MGTSTGVRHERQEVSGTDRVKGSSPVRIVLEKINPAKKLPLWFH